MIRILASQLGVIEPWQGSLQMRKWHVQLLEGTGNAVHWESLGGYGSGR